jgi:hypothetical protein
VLGNGVLKRGVDVAEPVFQDVGEANEDREADAAQLETIDQFLQVNRAGRILGRVDLDVAVAVD